MKPGFWLSTISSLLRPFPSLAAPDMPSIQACRKIANVVPDRVSYPHSMPYESEMSKYWSVAVRDVRPACIAHPTTPEEVSNIVKTLNGFPDVAFATKSGGHDPNPGHGSVEDGVLIALREITGTEYDENRKVAHVRPGGEWNDVIRVLDKEDVVVLGGRLGIVGIGGYLVQGGISFLSAQYGLAADGIIGWEIVFPNGTISYVDAEVRPDLAVALRGGGSQFGIVTRFTMETHPIGEVWGGVRLYDSSATSKIFETLHNFVPDTSDDGKSAIILSHIDVTGGVSVLLIFYFYDGPVPPASGPFADFLDIPSLIDTTSSRRYSSLTYTIPYIKDRPGMYAEIAAKWKEITSTFLSGLLHISSQCSVDFQPFPATISKASEARGGNAMEISESDGDRLLLELQCSWSNQRDDETLYDMSRQMTDWLDSMLPHWLEGEPVQQRYLPLFMNDAMGDQNVTGMYKGYARLKQLQTEIDPNGLFKARSGGYKF